MKPFIIVIAIFVTITSCKNATKNIVEVTYVDSLINNYNTPQAIIANAADISFWKGRITYNPFDIANPSNYATTLINRFHLLGEISDVKAADSILLQLSKNFNATQAEPYFSLVGHYILQHRFNEADSVFQLARKIGLKKYHETATAFDIAFEQGNIALAKAELRNLKAENDFGYQFRKSKMMHYDGELDSSIIAMQKALTNAGQEIALKNAAQSNLGDLYIHASKLNKAYTTYKLSIAESPADLHSIMGIGWITLMNDKNDSLAEKIFQFVRSKTKSPDPLLKLIAVAQQRGDTALQLKYASAFEKIVTDTLYGNMYNKYLIELYTGILNNSVKAVAIAQKELLHRNTPQTNAWLAWALLNDNRKEEAAKVYDKSISGKPLEGLELYYMGKLMKALGKNYNATQYFEAAKINIYDLNPAVVKDLKRLSKE